MQKRLTLFYVLLLLADVVLIESGPFWAHGVAKISLMPVLMAGVISAVGTKKNPAKLLLLALLFSGIGDAILLHPDWFLVGIACFLVTQLVYINLLWPTRPYAALGIRVGIVFLLVIGGGAMIILSEIGPTMGSLLWPVAVYGAALVTMVSCAASGYTIPLTHSWIKMIAGTLLFLISDSLLAIDKFAAPIPLAGTWVMATYGAAQWLIVQGFIDRWKQADIKQPFSQ